MKRSRIAVDLQVIIALGLWLCGGVLSVNAEESADLASHPEFWPKQVTIRPSLIVTKDKNTIKLPAGSEVDVVAFEKNNLVIERQGMTGRLPVEDTNFLVLYQANALEHARKKLIQSAPTLAPLDIPPSKGNAITASQTTNIGKLELPSSASFLETDNYVKQLYKLVQALPTKEREAHQVLIAQKLQAVDSKHLEALLMAPNFNKSMPYEIIDNKVTPMNAHLLWKYLRPEFYLYNQHSSFYTLLDILLSHGLHLGHETAIKTIFENHLSQFSKDSGRPSDFADDRYIAAMERLQIYPDVKLMNNLLIYSRACDTTFSLMFSENSPYSKADLAILLIDTEDSKRVSLSLPIGYDYSFAWKKFMARELRSNLASIGNIKSHQSIFEDLNINKKPTPNHRLFYKLQDKHNILFIGLMSRRAHQKISETTWESESQTLALERTRAKTWLDTHSAKLLYQELGSSPTFEKVGIYHFSDNPIIQEYNQFNQDPILCDLKIKPEKWAEYFQERILTETKTLRDSLIADLSLTNKPSPDIDNQLQPEAAQLLKHTGWGLIAKFASQDRAKIMLHLFSNGKSKTLPTFNLKDFVVGNLVGAESIGLIADYYPMIPQLQKHNLQANLPSFARVVAPANLAK